MGIDTGKVIAVEGSPLQLALGAAGAAAFVALGGWLLMAGAAANDPVLLAMGGIGVAFFGLCFVLLIWKLKTDRGVVLTIGPEGIWDKRVSAKAVPWSAVQGIGTWTMRRRKIMVLGVDPAVEATLGLTRSAQWMRKGNAMVGADGLCVSPQGLKIGYDEMLAATMAYAEAWRGEKAG